MQRRTFLRGAALSGLLSHVPALLAESSAPWPQTSTAATIPATLHQRLDSEIASYMKAMNAPGMAFCLTDLEGHTYVSTYGYENLDLRTAVSPDRLFQIGSISKSMAALLALQLVDEGKLDLHRPVLDYLPWLPWKTAFGPVTSHHLLTHTSGMPNSGPLFYPDPFWTHLQRYAPGQRFFYSNMAFETLGYLIASLDGRSYQQSLSARLLTPLGLSHTRPAIDDTSWPLQANSYYPAAPDRPYLRFAALTQAPLFHAEEAAGCVSSTPADMAVYLRFLLRGGVTDSGRRLVSDASFQKMSHSWIAAKEFGETASYGYGIAVDTEAGDHILLHTGGMVSFASSIYVNLTRGIAAFASINAMQGYRPTAVTHFAVQSLRAEKAGTPTPTHIEVKPASDIAKPDEFVGAYSGPDGTLRITANASQLTLHIGGKSLPMEGGDTTFTVDDAQHGRHSWVFERNAAGEVAGVGYASRFYAREGSAPLPAPSSPPAGWEKLVGSYVNDDPWIGVANIFLRRGRLYMDDALLTPAPDDSFFLDADPDATDRIAFRSIVDDRARILVSNGSLLARTRLWDGSDTSQ